MKKLFSEVIDCVMSKAGHGFSLDVYSFHESAL